MRILQLYTRKNKVNVQVSIKKMSLLFIPHLFLSSLSFSLFTFALCHSYDYDIIHDTWTCGDRSPNTYHLSLVTCHLLPVTCQLSPVTYPLLSVTCH